MMADMIDVWEAPTVDRSGSRSMRSKPPEFTN